MFYDINKRTKERKKEVFIHNEDDKELVKPYYEQSKQEHSKLKSRQSNNLNEQY